MVQLPLDLLDKDAWAKIIEGVSRVGSGFLIFGGAFIAICIAINQQDGKGMQVGILTLMFGAVFTVCNGLLRQIIEPFQGKKMGYWNYVILIAVQSVIWFVLLFIYIHFINQIFHFF